MDKVFTSQRLEDKWYQYWLDNNNFNCNPDSKKETYSIVIPPPNVTGKLHIGHALNITLQDILCRANRLMGKDVLWVPGTDHAGIATQNVVEKKLLKEDGTTRHDMSREELVSKIWDWKKEYGNTIINQLKKLGASCDWRYERFTMDDGLSEAVRAAFVRLYNDGLIYRGDYLINWCTRCHTALSDDEVSYDDKNGHLYYIKYYLEDKESYIPIATTRPETLLGDTAIAINPDDERYQKYKGGKVWLPIQDRLIPIITDNYVDTSFGTGALKVTPGHDPNDFELGHKHNLDSISIFTNDGKLNKNGYPYENQSIYECRENIVKDLEQKDLLLKIEDYQHSVGHCYRCETVIEPIISKQWFVKMKPLAKPARKVVETKKCELIPASWENTYYHWLDNVRDWCISRQIWWGHRLPVWYCSDCNEINVSKEDITRCQKCNSTNIVQEEDVLDTWFSSALWPMSTLGWPEDTKELKKYYPTSVLSTAFDILYFWVARMIMFGMYFKNDVPFRQVYIHALIRDAKGKKMSKSTGNSIDPIDMINEYGADTLRFTLCAFAAQGRDILLSEDRIRGYRNFINKLWNSARFIEMKVFDSKCSFSKLPDRNLTSIDKWIISEMYNTAAAVKKDYNNYKFNDAADKLYHYVWHTFCDWYIELKKIDIDNEQENINKDIVIYIFNQILIMLHPIIPFITEELYHIFNDDNNSIMEQHWPVAEKIDESETKKLELVIDVITGFRNIRSELNLSYRTYYIGQIKNESDIDLSSFHDYIIKMLHLEKIAGSSEKIVSKNKAVYPINDFTTVTIYLDDEFDPVLEKERLNKKLKKIKSDMDYLSGKLSNKKFVENAPDKIVNREKQRFEETSIRYQRLETIISSIEN